MGRVLSHILVLFFALVFCQVSYGQDIIGKDTEWKMGNDGKFSPPTSTAASTNQDNFKPATYEDTSSKDLKSTDTNDLYEAVKDYSEATEVQFNKCLGDYSAGKVRADRISRKTKTAANSQGMFGKCNGARKGAKGITGVTTEVGEACITHGKVCGAEGQEYNSAISQIESNRMYAETQPPEEKARLMAIVDQNYQFVNKTNEKCSEAFHNKISGIREEWLGSTLFQGETFAVCKKLKTGLLAGGAIVGGALIYKTMKDKKKDKKKAKKAAAEEERIAENAKNGIFVVDGEDMDCKEFSNRKESTCEGYLMEVCADEKSTSSNCIAFDQEYCADQGTDTSKRSYCLFAESKNYCAAQGGGSQSPACVWVRGRDHKACAKSPSDLSCMTAMAPDALGIACGSFARDPLCSAHKNGQIVTQPVASNPDATVPGGTNPDGSLPGRGGDNNANNIIPSTGPSLWITSSNANQQACTDGHVYDCGQGRYPAGGQ